VLARTKRSYEVGFSREARAAFTIATALSRAKKTAATGTLTGGGIPNSEAK
jgi:hypothetical protein